MTYFSYVHARPEAVNQHGIFYVGKGKEARCFDLSERNRYHGFVVDKYGKENILIGSLPCSNEQTAFDLEVGLIKCLRRNGVQLTNQTNGGDGSSGYKFSEESKLKMSNSAKLLHSKEDVKKSKSEKMKVINASRWSDPEYRLRTSNAMKGKKKTLSEAGLNARRENLKKAMAKRIMNKEI
jgi:hypothetical protein